MHSVPVTGLDQVMEEPGETSEVPEAQLDPQQEFIMDQDAVNLLEESADADLDHTSNNKENELQEVEIDEAQPAVACNESNGGTQKDQSLGELDNSAIGSSSLIDFEKVRPILRKLRSLISANLFLCGVDCGWLL